MTSQSPNLRSVLSLYHDWEARLTRDENPVLNRYLTSLAQNITPDATLRQEFHEYGLPGAGPAAVQTHEAFQEDIARVIRHNTALFGSAPDAVVHALTDQAKACGLVRALVSDNLSNLGLSDTHPLRQDYFLTETSETIYTDKYALKNHDGQLVDRDVWDTFARVALAVGSVELAHGSSVEKTMAVIWQFFLLLADGRFAGGGRIMANAGALNYKANTTLINCTVSTYMTDSIRGINGNLTESAINLKSGAGVGYDWSTLRPNQAFVRGAGAGTSGPISFMSVHDRMCATIMSAGGRRGAQMGVMYLSHPDVLAFIDAKRGDGALRYFNLSTAIPDAFMQAVKDGSDWTLWFWEQVDDAGIYSGPETLLDGDVAYLTNPTFSQFLLGDEVVDALEVPRDFTPYHFESTRYQHFTFAPDHQEVLSGNCTPATLFRRRVYRTLPAQELYDAIMKSTYDFAEPGNLFIDKIRQYNTLYTLGETLNASNPCFTGDTRVWTAQGPRTFADLAATGADVQVLTQTAGGKLVYRTMRRPRLTQTQAALVEVTLDNGQTVRCTPNHVFYLKDGRGVEAAQLQAGDRVESVYRSNANSEDYERPNNHRVVSVRELDVKEDVYCGTVDETSRFFLSLGEHDGVLVSNCGEQPLPHEGACNLGSMFLHRYVRRPFQPTASFAVAAFYEDVKLANRFLDNVNDITNLPHDSFMRSAYLKRRHGLGFTGLANALQALHKRYGEGSSEFIEQQIARPMHEASWTAAAELAQEKGPALYLVAVDDGFSTFAHNRHFNHAQLRGDVVQSIAAHGARYTHALSIAPTGTMSFAFGNYVANGIEPTYQFSYLRNVRVAGFKSKQQRRVNDWTALIRAYQAGLDPEALSDAQTDELLRGEAFVCTDDLSVMDHVHVQATVQRYIDSAISKTVNVPWDYSFDDFQKLYLQAWDLGLKGITTFRLNPAFTVGVLVREADLAELQVTLTSDTGETLVVPGHTKVLVDGELQVASNIADAWKEGLYGRM